MISPVLVVQHEAMCPPGLVGAWLEAEGLDLDVRRPYAGEPLPADLASWSGLVVLGGHMSANDDALHDWIAPTKALIRQAAGAGTPVLGICLGHQLAAAALGGEVTLNRRGQRRGVLDMEWLPAQADDPVMARCGGVSVQWHHDVVTRTPEGTVELARATTGELLAARFAPTVWGVQCHPEAGPDIVAEWAADDRSHATTAEEAGRVDAAFDAVCATQPELREGWRPLATGFADRVRAAAAAPASAQASG